MTRYSLNERIQCYCAEGECYYNIPFVCVCMCVFVCCGGAYLCVPQEKHCAYAYINGPPHFIGYAELLRNVTECIGERNTGSGCYNRVTYSHSVQ